MDVRPILIALGALALSGCVSMTQGYGYAYCYDAYGGPVGYHYGPFEPPPPCATQAAQAGVFVTQENGYRGAFVSGPHPGPVAPAAVDAATPAAVR